MSIELGNITLDCADTTKVAAFWSAALRRPLDEGGSEFFVSIGRDVNGGPGMFFIQVPEGKSVKNRLHLDLHADDRSAEVGRLLALGASHVADYDESGMQWTTLRDVEGNEFCVA